MLNRDAAAASNCEDEAEFARMYEYLGDRPALDAIRAETPDARHCPLLIDSPLACRHCHRNPRLSMPTAPSEEVDAAASVADDLREAVELYGYLKLGFTVPLDSVPARRAATVRVVDELVNEQREKQRDRQQEKSQMHFDPQRLHHRHGRRR